MPKTVRLWCVVLVALIVATGVAGAKTNVVIWDYVDWRIDYYRGYAEEYSKLHPDIEFELQVFPLGEYVDKVLVGIATDTAPTLFSFHPSFVADFAGLLEPFPQDLFPHDKLSEEMLGFDPLIQDGEFYYYPLGLQGPLLFINDNHWASAGLGEPPRTWKELQEVAARVTRRTNDATELAGFFFDDGGMMSDLFIDLNYQYGGQLYLDGGKRVAFDQPPALDAIRLITEMYNSGITGFSEASTVNFISGNAVMRYGWAWRQQQYRRVEGLEWSVAPVPTLSGELEPKSWRMDYYLGMAAPRSHDPEATRAGFEFLEWAYGDDTRLMDLNSRSGTLPARRSLWSSREILDNPVLYQLSQTLPYATYPGEFPGWMKNELQQVAAAIRGRTQDPAVVLQEITPVINARLEAEPLTWVVE